MRAFLRSLLWLPMLLLALAGCATPPTDPDELADFKQTNDPLEPTNRVFYSINNGIDTAVLKPASQAYVFIVPEPVRNGIHNILGNLGTPVQLSNDMLEGKPRRAGDTTMRFLINTTVGVLGFFDVAKGWGYPDHDADFGMTMAEWGAGPGPYLYLPILGPSDPRDFAGFGVDVAADPFTWIGQGAAVQGLNASKWLLHALDARSRLGGDIDNIKKTALDPYATFRSLYRQHRQSQIEEMENDNRATVPVWFPQPASAQPAPAQ
jgi:phospholipid-binding lipoprotein MlaA